MLCQSVSAQEIRTIDYIYDPQIRTVLLYPVVGGNPDNPAQMLNPSVIPQDEGVPLLLEFDDLTANYRTFRAKFLHCNTDWQRSALNDIEFTYEYNDYPITEYQVSINTKVPYYHYRFQVPKVKLPGNYLLVVYDERNPRNIIFTRRFRTYVSRVAIAANIRFSTEVERQFSDQQIEFTIDYKGYQVISPQDDFRVVIRQNYRDDRVVRGLKPTNVRVFDNILEYRLVDLSNTFPGGNEYRFFDIRTVLSLANFVAHIERRPDHNIAYIMVDQPRSRGVYLQSDDFNGQYVIDQRETRSGATTADYIETIFTLKMDEIPNAEVYVNGAFNLWLLNDRNRMTYNAAQRAYQASVLLKQGVYNYNYSVTGIKPPIAHTGMAQAEGNETLIEGNYSATENDYEIFVYNRPPGARADQLIGYRKIGYNKRK
ncbi:hypothetical protein GCM10023187_42310 [Nibrella viscosa]|uniref:Type 9 secretion system plug protein N-terminal domain-containing protein n=1 Tax=Nibrella viscosa TaxID=1084524 RepID=A0ABP8KQV5_9BACT